MIPGRTLQLVTPGEVVCLDRSRCLRHRFAPSGCRRCSDACPHGAISWREEGLQRDEKTCQGCMLCVAVCPSGAFTPGEVSLVALLRELAPEGQPVLACTLNAKSSGHARIPCLGLLAHPELLLALRHALGKPLTLNLTACEGCPNSSMVGRLRDAAERQEGLGEGQIPIRLVNDDAGLGFREKTCSRRELFGLLRRKSQQTAALLIDRLQDSSLTGVYGNKSLPLSRNLLLQVLELLPADTRSEIAAAVFPRIEFLEQCSGCTGCVGVCPTGALKPTVESSLHCDIERCTACGLCMDFCRAGAIKLETGQMVAPGVGEQRCSD